MSIQVILPDGTLGRVVESREGGRRVLVERASSHVVEDVSARDIRVIDPQVARRIKRRWGTCSPAALKARARLERQTARRLRASRKMSIFTCDESCDERAAALEADVAILMGETR